MSDSSSDSDCFESADEELNDENISIDDNVKSSKVKCDSGLTSSVSSVKDNESSVSSEINTEGNVPESKVQYRKRSERRKNVPKEETEVTHKTSFNDKIFTSQILKSDFLVQDITSNLTKNLNKGLNKIQQTSSSIKDLVIGSLPDKKPTGHSSKFSCDIDDEEEEEEKEIASYLPKSENDSTQDKCDEEVESLFDIYFKDCATSEKQKVQKPSLKDFINKKEYTDQAEKLDDNNVPEDIDLVSQVADEEQKAHETIRNIFEESEELKSLFGGKDFCAGLKAELNQIVSELGLNNITQENLPEENEEIKADEKENNCEDEFKSSDIEKRDDDFKLESAETEDNQKSTDSNNDGWDSFEVQLEEPDVKESCEISSVKNESRKTDIISADSEDGDVMLKNPVSSSNDGWDDFDFDDVDEELNHVETHVTTQDKPKELVKYNDDGKSKSEIPDNNLKFGVYEGENAYNNNKWPGWDNFGEKQETKQKSGWTLSNWGVNALLNTATSVTQGLSTVLEAGLGAPDPETLAKMEMESIKDNNEKKSQQKENSPPAKSEEPTSSNVKLFPHFGITNLVAGVTKNIVEHTKVHEIGSKVITGSLDTLESFGKKTMEVLQEGDPGLKKKRAFLLGADKPTLSHALREAKEKAEMENKKMEQQKMAKLCHFETLFDDFRGLIHLEALEMLSRQCEFKLEQLKDSLSGKELEDINDTLDEVKELCVIDEDEFKSNYCGMVDFKISLTKATESLQNEISVKKIIQIYEEFNAWFKAEKGKAKSSISLLEKALSVLAELTATTVQQFHKAGELLSVKKRRKTVEEADALLQMTGIVCYEIGEITKKFLNLYTSDVFDFDVAIENKIKEESANATMYIKDAFNLLIPVLQLGATA